ncbi:hypothetical protein BpHYR1_044521 [Brachionus plicatilis]|uniref:Uncharacterized protein n=1 Tax=Brachionus plicatilis TaxID=10195 RepID=A0A3M7SZI4_BRAPC|nr:hypothetical protein BpHYR1_044521 [Brachionus plicatilis]
MNKKLKSSSFSGLLRMSIVNKKEITTERVGVYDRSWQGIPLIDNPVRKGITFLRTFGSNLTRQFHRVPPDSCGLPGSLPSSLR